MSTAQKYNGKTLDELSHAEILALAGDGRFGPAIIGKELHERAEQIRIRTDNGRFGPAILDPDYGLDVTPWDEFDRKALLIACRQHQLPVKSNATREELAKALARAKKLPDRGEGAE